MENPNPNGLLHTGSHWLHGFQRGFSFDNFNSKGKISALEAKEKALYQKFGVNTFEEFRQIINKLFLEYPQDREILRRFSNENLRKELKQFSSTVGAEFNQSVRVIVNLNMARQNDIKVSRKTKDLSIDGVIEIPDVSLNTKSLKKIFNEYFSTTFRKESDWQKNLQQIIASLESQGVISLEDGQKTFYDEYIMASKNFPWGYTKTDIQNAIKYGNESDLYKQLDLAKRRIKDFITNTLCAGGSPDLIKAVNSVWNTNIGPGLQGLTFFEKGNNFLSGVIGALGEFQFAVLIKYIGFRTGISTRASIIGNKLLDTKVLGKTDVRIFNSLGIQVKNYSMNPRFKEIETNISASKFAEYIENSSDFLTFLANYFFNLSYQKRRKSDFEELKKYLGNKIGELYSLAVADSVSDTVTFYYISGRYLVPGSAILRAAQEIQHQQTSDNIRITSSVKGMDDDEYKKGAYKKYWERNTSSITGWIPKEKNASEFQKIIDSNISIRSSFPYQQLMMQYAIL